MKAISNVLKGVTYHNPQLGESLYELCRRATSRHIDRPDEILNQQVVYMINSEMHTPYAAKDACTCLKRRLQMDHPQKQYLAIILTSKVLQECHAAVGIYQGELLQEVAYILRTVRSSGPAAARTRQVAMDVLRHFGSAGGDAYRLARQQAPGPPVGARLDSVNRDPAAVAAERASLLDEIKRMCEQASASTEILNELILNKEQSGVAGSSAAAEATDSVGLRKELLADVSELRKLFDLYMEQLASLSGPDAEEAMKAALEAVDSLDNALSLEKDVDAELKDLQKKGQLPPPPEQAAPAAAPAEAGMAAGSSAAAAAVKMQSMNLIDLDDEPPAAAGAPAAAAAGPVDPFAPPPPPPPPPAAVSAALDPFAPISADMPADPFAAGPAAAAAAPADPFAALAAAGVPPAAAFAPAAASAADPFAEPSPWGAPVSSPQAAAAAASGQLLQQQGPSSGGGASVGGFSGPPSSGGGAPAAAGPSGSAAAAAPASSGVSGGGFMPPPPAAAAAGPYGAPVTPGYGGMMALQGMAGPYGYGMQPMQQGPSPYGMTPYGMPAYSPQVTGGPYGQPAATGPYPAVPSPYPSPYQQQQQQQPQPVQLMQQQQQQQLQVLGGFGATSPPASAGGTGGGVLSPTNPFATVAPAPAAGGVANPFQSPAVSAGGAAAASVDQEWNTFFSDNRPASGIPAGK